MKNRATFIRPIIAAIGIFLLVPSISLAQNTAPAITGDCGQAIFADLYWPTYAYFGFSDPDEGDTHVWSFTVSPSPPSGSVSISDGVLEYIPNVADDGMTFVFTVRVTDGSGEYDECDVTFDIIPKGAFEIEIEILDNQYQGHHSYVGVKKQYGSERMLGFDFFIGYDASALTFGGALRGDIFELPGDFEWEYFTYQYGDNCEGSCPSGMIQILAIADQNDGIHHPHEYIIPPGTILFTMDFLISSDYTLECTFVPISFFWRDCTDNSIAMNFRSDDPSHVLQAISDKIWEFIGGAYFDISDPFYGFPTYYGAQDECYDPQAEPKTAIPFVEYTNGGIMIICVDNLDDRGDINLNGVANEIADAVVFINYFIFGMKAFAINVDGQQAATDVNVDGIPLTIADLVYLIRIVIGDLLPNPKAGPPVPTNVYVNGNDVYVDAEIGAAHIVLNGDAEVSLAEGAAGMQIKSHFDGRNTQVIVYSFEKGMTATGNIIKTDSKIVEIEAANYYGRPYRANIIPSGYSLRCYPNPFNAFTTIEMSTPVSSDWKITICNIAGQKVEELSGYAETGSHKIIWDASALASGVYFYSLEIGDFSDTRKMILLK